MEPIFGTLIIGSVFAFLLWPRKQRRRGLTQSEAVFYNQKMIVKQMKDWPNLNATNQLGNCQCDTCNRLRGAYRNSGVAL